MMEEQRSAIRLSVVIPTYNGAARVPIVLRALARQSAPAGTFEIVVVDNNSGDDTGRIVEAHDATADLGRRGTSCRVVKEPTPGLTYARIRGTLAARGEVICFLDDDNVPEPDYVINGIESFADPSVGLVVSKVVPVWETPPPPSLRRRAMFACNEFLGDKAFDFGSITIAPTIGAGLWVRRDAFLASVPWSEPGRLLSDRTGAALTSGNDIEIGVLIGKAGYRRLYNPKLRINHLLPATRQSSAYVRRLIAGNVRSELALRVKYDGETYGLRRQAGALMRWFAAVLSVPILPVLRRDWRREAQFILAERWARVQGPIRFPDSRK